MKCWSCGARLRDNDFMCRACGSSAKRPSHVVRQESVYHNTTVRRFEYAGVFIRWVAMILDRALLGVISYLVAIQFHLLPDAEAMETALIEGQSIFDLAWIKGWMGPVAAAQLAIGVLYYTIGLSVWGRTLGALVTGIKVVDSTSGGRPFVLSAALRPLAADLSLTLFVAGLYGDTPALVYASFFTGFITNIGYTMAKWDAKSQTLHDKIAGTVVVSAGWGREERSAVDFQRAAFGNHRSGASAQRPAASGQEQPAGSQRWPRA